jgi:hypothetical protein
MRVSSLSDPRVIDVIRKYFVPAWLSRDDYQLEARSRDEQAELARLDGERSKRKMRGGAVCVFVVAPNGDVLATQAVQEAYKAENLLPLLKKIVEEQKVKPRDDEAIRASAAAARETKAKTKEGRFIHIWTRVDLKSDNRGVSNDRVELTAEELKAFVPPAEARAGTSWKIADKIAVKLFQYGYPPGPYWKPSDCKVKKATLTATLAAVSEKENRIDLSGDMELNFPLGRPTEGRITAHFVGVAREDRDKHALTALMLVSEQAEFVWYWERKPQVVKMRIALQLEP